MIEILETISEFSALGVAALAIVVLAYALHVSYQARKSTPDSVGKTLKKMKENHQHEIVEALYRIEQKLDKMNDNIIWIKSRINGRKT